MENKYITRHEDGSYVYDRYNAVIDKAVEIFEEHNIMPEGNPYGADNYKIVKLPDELHILVCGKDVASIVGVKEQYVNGSIEEIKHMFSGDTESIKECIKEIYESLKVGDDKYIGETIYRKDDWYGYFCGEDNELNEMLIEWGTENQSLVFEDDTEFSRFWHNWGRYFTCDISNN